MKKFGFLVTIIIIMTIFQNIIFAGDIPESIKFSDYTGDVLIGTVKDIDGENYLIDVSEFLLGRFDDKEIVLKNLELYYGYDYNKVKPEIGDYCAIAVYKENDDFLVYDQMAGKSNSLDRENLKLKSGNDFIKRFNEYINDGSYLNLAVADTSIENSENIEEEVEPENDKKGNSKIYGFIVIACIVAEAINLSYHKKK